MYLSLVTVLLAVGSVIPTSRVGQNKSQKFDYNFEINESVLGSQCENVMKSSNRKHPKIDGSEYLKYTSIVYGLLESVQNEQVDATCYADSKRIIDGVKQRETWAIKGMWIFSKIQKSHWRWMLAQHSGPVKIFERV
jgi:hypothetical protein